MPPERRKGQVNDGFIHGESIQLGSRRGKAFVYTAGESSTDFDAERPNVGDDFKPITNTSQSQNSGSSEANTDNHQREDRNNYEEVSTTRTTPEIIEFPSKEDNQTPKTSNFSNKLTNVFLWMTMIIIGVLICIGLLISKSMLLFATSQIAERNRLNTTGN